MGKFVVENSKNEGAAVPISIGKDLMSSMEEVQKRFRVSMTELVRQCVEYSSRDKEFVKSLKKDSDVLRTTVYLTGKSLDFVNKMKEDSPKLATGFVVAESVRHALNNM